MAGSSTLAISGPIGAAGDIFSLPNEGKLQTCCHATGKKAPASEVSPMTPAARAAAAIEVLTDIDARRRPAADAMKDWGLAHRFAGSGDRAAISSLVYDALRRKSSSAWIMGEASPRAEVLGALRQTRGLDVEAIAALFSGEGHAPAKLTEAEL